jgi:hypothetical protein
MPADRNLRDINVPNEQGGDGFYLPGQIQATYDFAVNGGAVGSILLSAWVPAGFVIVDGFTDVITQLTGAGASVALTVESAGDMLAATVIGTMGTTGRHALVPVNSAAASVKTTAQRQVTFTISGGSGLTAGKLVIYLRGFQSA